MAKTGRRTKLTPTVHRAIVRAVRAGNFLETAAALGHVDRTTVFSWLARGRKERDRFAKGEEPDPDEGIFLDFLDAIETAEAAAEAEHVAVIRKCAKSGDRKASEFYLTHKADRWKPGRDPEADAPDSLRGLVDMLAKARAERHG